MITILAISGSLRAASLNTALLRAACALSPAGVAVNVYSGLGSLPLFNPDLEGHDPATVTALRALVRAADGLMIASPEYAHGVTGAMKNALDWLVGGEEFINKPVALLNASPRAKHAYDALKETLAVMSARFVEEASIAVPLLGSQLDTQGIASHPQFAPALHRALTVFADAIRRMRAQNAT